MGEAAGLHLVMSVSMSLMSEEDKKDLLWRTLISYHPFILHTLTLPFDDFEPFDLFFGLDLSMFVACCICMIML